jgi:hypothetical protein
MIRDRNSRDAKKHLVPHRDGMHSRGSTLLARRDRSPRWASRLPGSLRCRSSRARPRASTFPRFSIAPLASTLPQTLFGCEATIRQLAAASQEEIGDDARFGATRRLSGELRSGVYHLSVACGEERSTSRTLMPFLTPGTVPKRGPSRGLLEVRRQKESQLSAWSLAAREQQKNRPGLRPTGRELRTLSQLPTGLADGFGLKELAYPCGIHPRIWVPRSPAIRALRTVWRLGCIQFMPHYTAYLAEVKPSFTSHSRFIPRGLPCRPA